MTCLKIRDDLMDIVRKGKDPVTRFSEAMRDLFGAIDCFQMVHYMEEQSLGLFGGKAELSLVSPLSLLLG